MSDKCIESFEKHSFFFEHDPMVVFSIGERLYKVHKYFLIRESKFFRDMFALPQADAGANDAVPVEGRSEEHPIVLADTTELEFDSILEFLYFSMTSTYYAPLDSWIAMLSIATRLLFDDIRWRAIREITAQLNSLDAVEVIVLAYKFDVHQWLESALTRVVETDEVLSDADAAKIPFADFTLITRCREARRKEASATLIPRCLRCQIGIAIDIHSSQLTLPYALAIVRNMLQSRENVPVRGD